MENKKSKIKKILKSKGVRYGVIGFAIGFILASFGSNGGVSQATYDDALETISKYEKKIEDYETKLSQKTEDVEAETEVEEESKPVEEIPVPKEETNFVKHFDKESDTQTLEQKNAIAEAKSYLDYTSFSRSGLIQQLEYEGYSNEVATYAVDSCNVDWNKQAELTAQSYLDYSSFSRDGLIQQLEYEGFSNEEALYGVTAVGY